MPEHSEGVSGLNKKRLHIAGESKDVRAKENVMRGWIAGIFLFLAMGLAAAQNPDLSQANTLYLEGKKLEALPLYEQLASWQTAWRRSRDKSRMRLKPRRFAPA